ncbi:acyltransferase family protein [Enterococcus pingfangensis]|uniref:acyltransferase family protein n=1 Tax=Enterococcus pingfangensis TaxID=2559924 RepID=UPI002482589C|nr:acyltransferase family protein [Enterococcus pingfangensis]
MKSRDYQIDNIKGLLIILVVFGHMLLASSKENNWLLTLIYSFHMPAFIFLNGVFSKNVNLRKVLVLVSNLRQLFVETEIN